MGASAAASKRTFGRSPPGAARGRPALRDTGADDRTAWGIGQGCAGEVDVFVQDATAEDELRVTEKVCGSKGTNRLRSRRSEVPGRPAAVIVAGRIIAGSTRDRARPRGGAGGFGRIANRQEGRHQVATAEVFTEVLMPPPRLIVWRQRRCDPDLCVRRGRRLSRHRRGSPPGAPQGGEISERGGTRSAAGEEDSAVLPLGPRSYAVVKMHSFAQDREWVKKLLDAGSLSAFWDRAPRRRSRPDRSQDQRSRLRASGPGPGCRGRAGGPLDRRGAARRVFRARAAHLRQKEAAIHAT